MRREPQCIMQSGPHKKPRGRPPKGKTWDPHQGEYVEPRVPSPPAPIDRTRSISTQSIPVMEFEDMMDAPSVLGGNKTPTANAETCVILPDNMLWIYNPKTRNTVANPVHIRRSISDQGTRVFIRGLEELLNRSIRTFEQHPTDPLKQRHFWTIFMGNAFMVQSKTPDQQNYLNSSDDAVFWCGS